MKFKGDQKRILSKTDKIVLSVSAALTFQHLNEHNVYSCPDDFPIHDSSVNLFAPRDDEGEIHRVYFIAQRMVTTPIKPEFPPKTKTEFVEAILGYIQAVSRKPGILDRAIAYRFYAIQDLENGRLPRSQKVHASRAAHVYLALSDLLTGSGVVQPLSYCEQSKA